jgi:hypothetical protein
MQTIRTTALAKESGNAVRACLRRTNLSMSRECAFIGLNAD